MFSGWRRYLPSPSPPKSSQRRGGQGSRADRELSATSQRSCSSGRERHRSGFSPGSRRRATCLASDVSARTPLAHRNEAPRAMTDPEIKALIRAVRSYASALHKAKLTASKDAPRPRSGRSQPPRSQQRPGRCARTGSEIAGREVQREWRLLRHRNRTERTRHDHEDVRHDLFPSARR